MRLNLGRPSSSRIDANGSVTIRMNKCGSACRNGLLPRGHRRGCALRARPAGLLGQATFVGSFGPAHILCAPETGETDGSSKHPTHAHLPCCPAAHVATAPVLPPTVATDIVWPGHAYPSGRVAPRSHGLTPRAAWTRPRVRAPPVA